MGWRAASDEGTAIYSQILRRIERRARAHYHDYTNARMLRAEIRLCYNMLDPKPRDARWLDLRLGSGASSIDENTFVRADADPVLRDVIMPKTYDRIARFLGSGHYTPFEAVIWLTKNVRGSLYLGSVKRLR